MSVTDLVVVLFVVAGYVASVYFIVIFVGNKRLQRIEHRLEYLISRTEIRSDGIEAKVDEVVRQLNADYVEPS
jgi:hypothetical protein